MKKIPLFLSLTFAIAIVMTTGGAGCSTNHVTVYLEAEAEPLPEARPHRDSAGDDAGACPSTITPDPGALPWKPPSPPRGACTNEDYFALDQYVKATANATTSEVAAFVRSRSQACHDCIFTDASAATWGPVPMQGDQLVTINVGGCFALLSGNEACGKDIQNDFDCEYDACALCPDDQFDGCRVQAQKTVCASFVAKEPTDCVSAPFDVNDRCGTFMRSVKVQCVGDPDAGDAGDGGDSGDASQD